MNKGIISTFLSLIIIIAVSIWFNMRGPDISHYQHFKDPAISTKSSQRMLVVEAKGSPGKSGKRAFGLLFRAYFGIKHIPKGKNVPAPRARWPIAAAVPQSEWIGRYAMAIPDTLHINRLPKAPIGLTIETTTWEYGEVAEILYRGPYDKETTAIERLYSFIKNSGYEIIGEHEEEYLRGPGMVFKGNPEKYVTIIRYQVKKQAAR